jgi:hypothetical protein
MPSELTKEDIFRMFAETDRRLDKRFEETDRRLDKRFEETDRRLDKRFEETDKAIKELATLFTGQWGKLVEALVRPSALKLFQERGVNVTETYQRVESYRNGSQMEIDILLADDEEAVVIEVKTTLKVADVRAFLDDLTRFTFFFPRYNALKLYSGMEEIQIEEGADRFAYRHGLFVLASSGEGMVRILNNPEFKPRNFGNR